jgi:type III secretory pathway component EscS
MSEALAYAAAVVAIAWGAAHLVPTRAVVSGFGELTASNRLILTMEWVAEGATLIFIGILVAVTQSVGGIAAGSLSAAIKLVAAAMLLAMAVLTALTGARSDVVFFKICPVVKGVAALLLIASAVT